MTLMAGSGFSQVIPLIAAPIIARLFTPSEIGILAFYFSFVTIISSVASGRYEPAIAIAKSDEDALNLTSLSIVFSFCISLVTLIGIMVYQHYYSLFNGSISESWAYAIPILIWIVSVYNSLRFLAIRHKKFRSISLSSVSESLLRAIISILLGILSFGPIGLIIGSIAGKLSSFTALILGTKNHTKNLRKVVQTKKMVNLSKRYIKFPKYDLPATLLHSFGNQGSIILILKFFSEKTAGFYSYTERILITPVSLVSTSFAQVFLEKISKIYHEDQSKFRDVVMTNFSRFVWYSLLPFAIFIWATKFLVPILFGANWAELYKYIWVLSPYILLVMANSPVREVFYILNKQEKLLITKGLFFVLRFSALITSHLLGYSPLMSIFLFSIASAVSYLLNIIFVLHLLKVKRNFTLIMLSLIMIVAFVMLYNIV
jgi:O-antigen/teichoic acid export membrane protein